MSAISEQHRAQLKEAWQDYCNALREEGLAVLDGRRGDPMTPQELAEELRAVARIGVMSLQHRLDFNDPDFPTFFRTMDDRYRYGGPDAYITYLTASLRGGATYRLRANHHHREFNVNAATPVAPKDAAPIPSDFIRERWTQDVTVAADGSFELELSSEPQPHDWIGLAPDLGASQELPDEYPMANGGLMLRTYYWDPHDSHPQGQFFIERTDDEAPLTPEPLSPARLANQLSSAGQLCRKASQWWIARAARMRVQNPPNVVGSIGKKPPGVENFSPPKAAPLNYGVCPFELAADEALYIETDITAGLYWSFQLYNAWWESPDVQHRQTSLSFKEAHIDRDGRFRCVVSQGDPGVPNWLDSGGARRGFVFYRWLRPSAELPSPSGRVIPVAQVRSLMPADHPWIDRATRRRHLSARRAWFAGRFQT